MKLLVVVLASILLVSCNSEVQIEESVYGKIALNSDKNYHDLINGFD